MKPIEDLSRMSVRNEHSCLIYLHTVTLTVGTDFVLGFFNKFPETFGKFLCRRFILLRHHGWWSERKFALLTGYRSGISPAQKFKFFEPVVLQLVHRHILERYSTYKILFSGPRFLIIFVRRLHYSSPTKCFPATQTSNSNKCLHTRERCQFRSSFRI